MTIPTIAVDAKIGRWRILRIVHRRALCACDCGSTHEVSTEALADGSSLGCPGCSSRNNNRDQRPRLVPDWRPERGR